MSAGNRVPPDVDATPVLRRARALETDGQRAAAENARTRIA